MMRLARKAALLVAFLLLDSTATAHAERAWVLWTRDASAGYGFVDEKPWQPIKY